jgi:hypothetical protein
LKKKGKFFTKTKLIIGCGCLMLCCVVMCGVFGLLLLTSKSYRERDLSYENEYNYSAIKSPPWLYDEDELKEFEKKKSALEGLGIDIDGEFYKDVLEADASEDEPDSLDDSIDIGDGTENTDNSDQRQDQAEGLITNDVYSYSFEVSSPNRYRQVASKYDFQGNKLDQHVYCYKLDDTNYESMSESCNTGELEIFMITVFNQDLYDEYSESPVFSGLLLSQDVADTYGLYFVLEHPNGILPDEISSMNDIIEQVKSTFTYTSATVG